VAFTFTTTFRALGTFQEIETGSPPWATVEGFGLKPPRLGIPTALTV
jgi:hypothetical protein